MSSFDDLAAERAFTGASPTKTLLALYRPQARRFITAAFWFGIKSSPAWLLPVIVATMIDALRQPTRGALLSVFWCGAAGIIALAQNIATHGFYMRSISRATRSVEASLRMALCRRLQELSISFYRFRSAGQLQSKVLRDVENVDLMARQMADLVLNVVVLTAATLIVTAWRAPWFIPFYLLTVPTVWLVRRLMYQRLSRANAAFRHALEKTASSVAGMIELLPLTRAHAAEKVELEKVGERLENVRLSGHVVDRENALFGSSAWVIFNGMYLMGVVLASSVTILGLVRLTAGEIVMLSGFFNTIAGTVMALANGMPTLSRGIESIRSIGEILDSPDLERNEAKLPLEEFRGEIVFEDVSFSYPDAPEVNALTRISFHAKAGQTIAVLGPSGCGKSTLMSLLLGFQSPGSGRILVDGKDMAELNLRAYRRSIAVVAQETLLFAGTLRENVLYGSGEISNAELEAALRAAIAMDFTESLPQGLETVIGEHGAVLSGGQRQRLAIARALLRNPRVLLLDEATAALDRDNEVAVQESIDRLRHGRTTFIVAHDEMKVRHADVVIRLKKGCAISVDDAAKADGELAHCA